MRNPNRQSRQQHGAIQWCAQQRGVAYDLMTVTPERLKANDVHKPCEAGCSLGCVRMVSHTLGEPLKTFGASVKLAVGMSNPKSTHSPKKEPSLA
jgi:hypothetical protein